MPEITQETPANQRMMKTVGKLKNPLLPMDKIQAKPIAQQPYSRTVSKVKTPAKTQPELAREYEMSRRARKSAPTFNEITTGIKLGINKAAQKVSGVTKVKIADKLRSTFAPNTTVKREYADPTRVGLGDWSKLGDKKIVQKLDKDGTVLKTKTKQVVSKKREGNRISGYVSIKKSKRSKFADEGVEGFSNKRTRYRAIGRK
tara:strand:+ start:774 stop:1379 length:606 start_codon:yes stop_codon:yes gene_type:complete